MSQKPPGRPGPVAPGAFAAEVDTHPARILLVDDNEDILHVIQRTLAHQPYQIFTAMNGREALDTARREMPDLMLLDVMLPEVDGLTVCRQLKSDPATRGIMILLVTGRGSIENRAEGLDSGADDYIPKPFHLTELLARVRSALRIKRLTDELRDKNRQLVESQRDRLRAEKMATIGLLATGLAHEFNNIMSGISGYAQLARKNPKFRDQLVEVALVQSERALELTRSLSTFYRPSPENRPVRLGKVVENALCLVAKEMEERRIKLELKLGEVSCVRGSAGQLQEVILNLAINALHAIDSDGVLQVTLTEADGWVELTVRDNGCGIPSQNLDRIFDPFFTTKGALGGGKQSGSGLGLSVSYNIVRAHAGTISVKSAPGQGATFTVSLPACPDEPAPTPAAATAAGRSLRDALQAAGAPGAPRGPSATPEPRWGALLVADVEESVREMAEKYLAAAEVAGVQDWPSALERIGKKHFEFIILDSELPGLPPVPQALEEIARRDREARVILTSRRFPDGALQQALENAWGHLLKPYTLENLALMMAHQPVATS